MEKKLVSIIIRAVIIIVTVATTFAVHGYGPYSGTVHNSDGEPIANVSVTDGRNVVKTDKDGNFTLKGWNKTHFITVTVPAGYQTDNYYIPVERKKKSYDFVLEKSEVTSQENHCFIQISDTEIGEKGTGEWLDSVKEIIKEKQPAFLIHTGDICYEAGLKKHITEVNTETMGCTVRYVIGNHDYVKGKYGEQLYESIYGPVWYSFDVGKTHYVVTSFQTGSDYLSCYDKNDRWIWLKNDLANVDSDMNVVMFNHTKSPTDDYVLPLGIGKLDLKEHNLIAWVFGHYHYNYVSEINGVVNISAPRPDCGGIDSSAAGTRTVYIGADGSVKTEMDYYDLNASQAAKNAVWSTKLNGNVLFCDTVLDGGSVYTATVDDDYPGVCGVYNMDAESGNRNWFFQTKNSVKNNVCVAGNSLLAMDVDGNVYCLNKVTGEALWQRQLKLVNNMGTSSAICENNGVLYAGNSRIVTALNISDGSVKWSVERDRGENSPAEFIVAGDKLIVNSHWDALAAMSIKDGKELWSNTDGNIRFRSSTPVVVDKNTLLVADDDAVMLVDLSSGKITSKNNFDGYNFSSSGQPVIRDLIAYIPTANRGIIAFDTAAKKIVWEFETKEGILFTAPYTGKGAKCVESSPIIDGDNLVFGANDGYIYTLDLKTGKEINSKFAGSAVLGKVAVTDSYIYAGTFDGYAVCFEK